MDIGFISIVTAVLLVLFFSRKTTDEQPINLNRVDTKKKVVHHPVEQPQQPPSPCHSDMSLRSDSTDAGFLLENYMNGC